MRASANYHCITSVGSYFLILRVRSKCLTNQVKVQERHDSMDILGAIFCSLLVLSNGSIDSINEHSHS